MNLLQTPVELEKIQADLERSLSPSVLPWTPANIQMLSGYAAAHFAKDGVVDMSFANLWKAIKALKGSLTWKVAPQSQQRNVYGAESRGLKNHAQPEEKYEIPENKDARKIAQKAALTEASQAILGECVQAIQGYQGRSHSKTFAGRSVLKEMFDKTTARGPVPPDVALHLLERIKERAAKLYEEQ